MNWKQRERLVCCLKQSTALGPVGETYTIYRETHHSFSWGPWYMKQQDTWKLTLQHRLLYYFLTDASIHHYAHPHSISLLATAPSLSLLQHPHGRSSERQSKYKQVWGVTQVKLETFLENGKRLGNISLMFESMKGDSWERPKAHLATVTIPK